MHDRLCTSRLTDCPYGLSLTPLEMAVIACLSPSLTQWDLQLPSLRHSPFIPKDTEKATTYRLDTERIYMILDMVCCIRWRCTMGSRIERLEALASHAWYHKVFRRCTKSELEFMRQWIRDHDHLSVGEWEPAVSRIYVTGTTQRHKHWLDIIELLTICK